MRRTGKDEYFEGLYYEDAKEDQEEDEWIKSSISNNRVNTEKKRKQREYVSFMDLERVHDKVSREVLWHAHCMMWVVKY